MYSEEGWYGILVNGVLEAVQFFNRYPLIWDFHLGYFNSRNDYEIVEVDVRIVGRVKARV